MTKTLLLTVLSAGLMTAQQKPLTTNAGTPVGDNQNSKTAGEDGPVLLEDIHLIEKLASFDRERIPERVVHARAPAHTAYSRPPAIFRRIPRRRFWAPPARRRLCSCASRP